MVVVGNAATPHQANPGVFPDFWHNALLLLQLVVALGTSQPPRHPIRCPVRRALGARPLDPRAPLAGRGCAAEIPSCCVARSDVDGRRAQPARDRCRRLDPTADFMTAGGGCAPVLTSRQLDSFQKWRRGELLLPAGDARSIAYAITCVQHDLITFRKPGRDLRNAIVAMANHDLRGARTPVFVPEHSPFVVDAE